MKLMTIVLGMILGIAIAAMDAGAVASEPPDTATDAVEPAAADETVAKEDEPLAPPPGFKMKQRGKYLLYCKREAPMGSRMKVETCYDEQQMRDYLLALEQGKVDIDRTRAICSNPCVCGMQC